MQELSSEDTALERLLVFLHVGSAARQQFWDIKIGIKLTILRAPLPRAFPEPNGFLPIE